MYFEFNRDIPPKNFMVQFALKLSVIATYKEREMAENNQEQVKRNLQDTKQWIRILYMVLFWIVLYFSMVVAGVLIFIQVLFALLTGEDNKNLRQFAADLTRYINQILLFLTYNENRKPFPFATWGELEEQAPIEAEMDIDEHEAFIDVEAKDDKPST